MRKQNMTIIKNQQIIFSMNSTKHLFRSIIAVFLISVTPTFAQKTLTLEECREMALEQNKKIKMSQQDAQAAAYTKKSAATHYLPKISFGGGYLRTNKSIKPLDQDLLLPIVPFNSIDPSTGMFNPNALNDPETALNTLVIDPNTGAPMTDAAGNPIFKNYAMLPADKLTLDNNNLYYARLSLSQPLFTGFKIVESNKMARHAENIANKNVVLTKAEVLSKTDEAYWRVVSLNQKVKLAQSYEALLDQLVTDLENMYAEGIITKNDVLKAQVKQNESKLQVLKAENGLALSKMALAQIVGIDSGEYIDVMDKDIDDNEVLLSSSPINPEASAENRAEISMLKEKVSVMQAQRNIERSKFMPSVLLTGGYGFANPNPYNGLKNEFGGDWSVGVVVSMPIFTWGERKHDMNVANMKKIRAQYELDDAREMINLEIRQNQFKHIESIKKVEMTKLSVLQAEENMNTTKDNLSEGRTTLSELLEAQLQWADASSEHIDALIEVKTTLTELEKSTGEIYKHINNN